MAAIAADTLDTNREAVRATRDQNRAVLATLLVTIIGAAAAAWSARVAATTLANLDRPHLFILTRNAGIRRNTDQPYTLRPETLELTPTTFGFINQGRAPALVRRLHAARIALAAMRTDAAGNVTSPSPIKMHPLRWFDVGIDMPHGASISANGEESKQSWSVTKYGIDDSDLKAATAMRWFIVGYVVYSDPARSAQYVTGFGLEWDFIGERWILGMHGKDAHRYNYSRRLHWPERAFWACVNAFQLWRSREAQRRFERLHASAPER